MNSLHFPSELISDDDSSIFLHLFSLFASCFCLRFDRLFGSTLILDPSLVVTSRVDIVVSLSFCGDEGLLVLNFLPALHDFFW